MPLKAFEDAEFSEKTSVIFKWILIVFIKFKAKLAELSPRLVSEELLSRCAVDGFEEEILYHFFEQFVFFCFKFACGVRITSPVPITFVNSFLTSLIFSFSSLLWFVGLLLFVFGL